MYPGIKPPSREFVLSVIIDHGTKPNGDPVITKQELEKIIYHRLHMRYYFSNKYKTRELATGKKYELDEMEEYDPTQLNAEELEILEKQRERRKQKGKILSIEVEGQKVGDIDNRKVICEFGRELSDGQIEPLTDSEVEYFWLQPYQKWNQQWEQQKQHQQTETCPSQSNN